MWRSLLTFVRTITIFVKKREKLIPIILYIYAAVDACSATFYYLKLLSIYNWAKVGTMYSKMGGRGEPRISKNLPRWAAEFGKQRRKI